MPLAAPRILLKLTVMALATTLCLTSLSARALDLPTTQALAENGSPVEQFNLGWSYETGNEEVAQDEKKALQWYQKSAAQGNVNAQFNMAVMYHEGRGTAQDLTKARYWYQKAAAQGDKDAQYNLAVLYENGIGVATDYLQAFKWYLQSAGQGDAEAQYKVGFFYHQSP